MSILKNPSRQAFPAGIDQLVERMKVTLTSAQVLALNTTPVVLVPAPGAGRAVDVISVTMTVNFNSVAYTGANNLQIMYTNGSGAQLTTAIPAANLNAGATASFKVDDSGSHAVTLNAPVVAFVPTANPAAGNSTVSFDIHYRNVNLP